MDLLDRLANKIEVGDDCWEWTAGISTAGYGMVNDAQGRYTSAHRVVWEAVVGPVPPGLELDHLCRNRACVNPDHLEPVTHSVNVLRGIATERRLAVFAAITHCPQGHEYTEANTSRWNNKRKCRTCHAARERDRRRKRTDR